MKFRGNAIVFGDHVNTDEIIPARYLTSSDPKELALYLMEDIRPGFGKRKDLEGRIIVAGENFGCGSSREHAPVAIRAAGIACVVARSYARLFLRNSVNIGLPVVEIEDVSEFNPDDLLDVDLDEGKMINHTRDKVYSFRAFPGFLQDIFIAGGWLEYVRKQKNSAFHEYLQEIAQFPYKIENIIY